MKYAFDAHCHIMTLARPCIGPYTDAAVRGGVDTVLSTIAAPNYLLSGLFAKGGELVRNVFSVIENDPAAMLEIMEDDLLGRYPSLSARAKERPSSLESGGKFRLLGEDYDALVVMPLMMDFSRPVEPMPRIHYDAPSRKLLSDAVHEILGGISRYRRERPQGMLRVRPFLGMDPAWIGITETESILERYFRRFSRFERASIGAFGAANRYRGNPEKPQWNAFAGIKLYPPLGFDPWPDDAADRSAVKALYSYCVAKGIPLVTHCDDEGFRTTGLHDAAAHTSPERWRLVLFEYPLLTLCFAHFGKRYLRVSGNADMQDWTRAICGFMREYPNIYADVSFNGVESSYWASLQKFLDSLGSVSGEIVRSRLQFGTDFFISLAKAPSYRAYWDCFLDSPLDLTLKRAMISDTPAKFLFGE